MDKPDVIVVGAGVFGVWTALELQGKGLSVCLVDAWGVGHSRASSAGESRVIRMGYGDRALYSEWAAYALERWKCLERELELTIFIETGVLWMGRQGDEDLAATRKVLDRLRLPYEQLERSDLKRQFPQISPRGIDELIWEPSSGVLMARYACRQIARKVLQDGGQFRLASVETPRSGSGHLPGLRLQGGSSLSADAYVFCSGPWMPQLFPELLGPRIQVSRQPVFFFGTPPTSQSFLPGRLPVWIDLALGPCYYGLPVVGGRSLKVACDESGAPFDPTHGERFVEAAEVSKIRGYLGERFPELADAPLLESRVCQYSRSDSSHLLVDRHPEWSNVVLAAAGSGHGFKLGPAVGRLASQLLTDPTAEPPLEVALG